MYIQFLLVMSAFRISKWSFQTRSKKLQSLAQWQRQYEQLRRSLSQIGYISQGSVQDRTSRPGGGAGYQWTRKVAQKTVTVSLTPEQFGNMKGAICHYRKLHQQLKQMEQLSRRIIFLNAPHSNRRKRLSQSILGIK
jgi:hypothetical protein